MSACIILNPSSGYAFKQRRIKKWLAENLPPSVTLFSTEYAGHASLLARQAREKGFKRIIAVGGDGTINEIASQLVHHDVALGIIPAGSGNGLARSLGLPLSVTDAFETALNGRVREIDAGCAGEHYFFTVCGVGLDAVIGLRFQRLKIRGIIPYFYFGVKEFLKYAYPRFRVATDEKDFSVAPLTLVVSNGMEFGNGARIAPQALMDDGQFDICILQKMSFLHTARALPKLFNGNIINEKSYASFRARSVKIIPEEEYLLFHVDGEPIKHRGGLNITLYPGALKVIV